MPDVTQTFVDSVISISASSPATFDSVGYAALSYTDIGEITDWNPGEKTYNTTPTNPVAQRRTSKYKGTYNNGADSLVINRDDDDAGQVICLSALDSDAEHSFKVTYQDGTIDYFQGLVVGFSTGAGNADSLVTRNMQVERTRDTVTA